MPEKKSLAGSMALLPERERKEIINSLSDEEVLDLLYDWQFWARPKQLPPPGDWFGWMLRAGRGFGKTRSGAEFIIDRARKGYRRIALIGQTKADVRDAMVEVGDSSILRISHPNFRPIYEPSKRRLTWPNETIAIIYSGDEPDQLRGEQHDTAWIDELAKFKYSQDTWDNMELGLRLGPDPRVIISTTPRPIPIIKALIEDPDIIDVVGSSYENIANLSEKYIERIIKKYEGTRLGKQEIYAQILSDNPDALWTRKILEKNRINKAPELVRIAVAIDPEATANEMSSETGIIGGGISEDDHCYILEDVTLKGTPDKWGNAAVALYYKLKADRIIGEVNNGGDMVEHVIRSIDKKVSYKAVRASRGKYVRAEPVSALYEQKKIHHVGYFPELEDQLCEWVPGDKSPDRLDALVWLVTELMLGDEKEPGFYVV
jgi:phage terminase large subunit-like protein